MVFGDCDTYDGDRINDDMHGKGTFNQKSDGSVYVGDYVNGERTGQSKMVLGDGNTYDGVWVNGHMARPR